MSSFMAHPSNVLLSAWGHTPSTDFGMGRLAMALEVITAIRSIEDVPVVDDHCKAAVVAALETLIVDQGLADLAYETYDRLAEWRKVKFSEIQIVPDERVPEGTAVFVSPEHDEPLGRIVGLSSPALSHQPDASRISKTRALQQAHHGQDASTSDELEALHGEEVEGLSSDESTQPSDPTGSEDSPDRTQQ